MRILSCFRRPDSMHVLTYLLEVQVKGTKNSAANYLAVPGWVGGGLLGHYW